MTTASTAPQQSPESFAALFEESLSRQEMRIGEVITAEVVRVDYNIVVVNAGLKSESFIPVEEFKNDRGEIEVKPGDFISVAIESLEDGYGETRLSRDKASIANATMWWFLAALFWKHHKALIAKPYCRICRKARLFRALSKILPIMARLSTWAASMACCTLPTWHGAASSTPQKWLTSVTKSLPKYLNLTKRKIVFPWA